MGGIRRDIFVHIELNPFKKSFYVHIYEKQYNFYKKVSKKNEITPKFLNVFSFTFCPYDNKTILI